MRGTKKTKTRQRDLSRRSKFRLSGSPTCCRSRVSLENALDREKCKGRMMLLSSQHLCDYLRYKLVLVGHTPHAVKLTQFGLHLVRPLHERGPVIFVGLQAIFDSLSHRRSSLRHDMGSITTFRSAWQSVLYIGLQTIHVSVSQMSIGRGHCRTVPVSCSRHMPL